MDYSGRYPIEKVKSGYDVNALNQDGVTALYIACCNGHIALVKQLLSHPMIDVNKGCCLPTVNVTPLYKACEKGFSDVVRLLLSHEAIEVNRCSEIKTVRISPLYIACEKGHREVVACILEAKQLIAEQQNKMYVSGAFATPLHVAVINSNFAVMTLLCLDPRFNANQPDFRERTALHLACDRGCVEGVRILLQAPLCEINAVDSNGATPLFFAARKGRDEVVRLLLAQASCDVNRGGRHNRTPLHMARIINAKKVLELLVKDARCQEGALDCDGVPAFHYTPCSHSAELCNMNVNVVDAQGRTLAHRICEEMREIENKLHPVVDMDDKVITESEFRLGMHKLSSLCYQTNYCLSVCWGLRWDEVSYNQDFNNYTCQDFILWRGRRELKVNIQRLLLEYQRRIAQLQHQDQYKKNRPVLVTPKRNHCSESVLDNRTLIESFMKYCSRLTRRRRLLDRQEDLHYFFRRLLKHENYDVSVRDFQGRTIFHAACVNNQTELVMLLLAHTPVDCEAEDHDG